MNLKQAIQQLAQTGDERYAKICEVISVNADNKTADLQPLDGSSAIDDAYLQVDDNGVFVEPKVGSLVACVFVTKEMAVIVNHSQIKLFQLQIEQTEFQIDENGFLLKKENETLARLMADLIGAIQNMVFSHPQGPTTGLINAAEFTALAQRFQNLLKDD